MKKNKQALVEEEQLAQAAEEQRAAGSAQNAIEEELS